MPKVFVTRREVFSSAHRLFNPLWDKEKNDLVFDKCSNENGHGHNYTLEVICFGEINPETGYVIDLKELKDIIRSRVIQYMDHKHLNFDTPFLKNINPTAENIAVAVWQQLESALPKGLLHSVKLFETENNYAEYKGD